MRYDDECKHEGHHPHTLVLKPKGEPFTCDGCKEKGLLGQRFECAEGCNFHLHKECAEAPRYKTHKFYGNDRTFELFFFRPEHAAADHGAKIKSCSCSACGRRIRGWHYHRGCNRRGCCPGNYLHASCMFLLRRMRLGNVAVELKKELKSECDLCHERELDGERTWAYVSKESKVQLHINCVKELVVDEWEKRRAAADDNINHGGRRLVSSTSVINRSGSASASSSSRALTVVPAAKGKARGFLANLKKVVKMVLAVVVSVIFGDPTAIAVGLVTALFSQ